MKAIESAGENASFHTGFREIDLEVCSVHLHYPASGGGPPSNAIARMCASGIEELQEEFQTLGAKGSGLSVRLCLVHSLPI